MEDDFSFFAVIKEGVQTYHCGKKDFELGVDGEGRPVHVPTF